MSQNLILASAVTLTGSAAASTKTASISGMIGHTLSVVYTPGTDSTNALNLTIETSQDGSEVTDANAKWDVLESWANSSGTLTKTNYLLSMDSSGTSAQTADLMFNKQAARLRVKYSETNTPTPFGTITAILTSSSEAVIPNIASAASISGTVTVDSELPAAAALADSVSPTTSVPAVAAYNMIMGTSLDRQRAITNGFNSSGTGIAAAGMVAQFDDSSPTLITENQWGNVRISQNRNLYQTIRDAAGNERGANVDSSNRLSVSVDNIASSQTIATVTALTGGGVAHDGADSGNPLKVGGRAVNAEIAAVANNDRSDFVTDLTGKQIVLPYANPENFVSGCISSAMTGTTTTSLLAAPASGLRNYITQITASCAHATQGTDILIQDGSGGTTLYVIPAAALYGGCVVTFPVPLRQPTTATAIYCANVTTGSSTKVSASGYKGS